MRRFREDKRFTHDIDCVCRTGETVWVVLDDVRGFENALDGAGFDVELVVAEAVPPAGRNPSALCFTSFVAEYCALLTSPLARNSSP